jgi:hypothetical protein
MGVLATTSQAAEFLDVEQPTHTTIWGGPAGERQSQRFTTGPTTEYITAISYKVWNPAPTGTVTLTLRTFKSDGQNPDADWETGTLLGTKTETFVGASDGDFLRFDFDVPVDVNPNTFYTAFFTNVSSIGGDHMGYYRSNTDPYSGGFNSRFVPGSGWDNQGWVSDLAFRVYGDTEFPVVIFDVEARESDSLCFISEAGKVYWLQATTDMVTSSNWETVGATIAGDGGVKYLFDPTEPTGSSTSKLYRILGN